MAQNVVALFAGAGGFSLGFSQAGLKPRFAFELNAEACATYRANQPTECIQCDLSEGVPDSVKGLEDCFALIGGPPCQGFSTAGARDASDPRNKLIFSYLEIVQRLNPRWFIFENVEGLLTSNDGLAVSQLVEEFVRFGYWVRLEKINFAGFGLPQGRKRVVIVGNRLGLDYRFPDQSFRYEGTKHRKANGHAESPTVSQALAGLPKAAEDERPLAYDFGPQSSYDERMRINNADGRITLHVNETSATEVEKLKLLKPGQSMKDLPEEYWPPSFRSRRFRRVEDGVPTENRGGPPTGIKRMDPSHVSLTITSAATRELGHFTENRTLTLRECARLQSFPDGYQFLGSRDDIATQIGNAFPPLVASLLAHSILEWDGHAGTGSARQANRKPCLLGYRLTEATAMSPALKITNQRLAKLCGQQKETQTSFFSADTPSSPPPLTMLDIAQKKLITKARTANPIVLSDRELARLVSVLLVDLNRSDLVPDFCRTPKDYTGYYYLPLDWFRTDEQRPFKFEELFLKCCDEIDNFEVIFRSIAELHKRRRKFELILRNQPLPTMDQVGRKGLLEFGILKSPALTSWLVWRKWIYDIDNRSAQETGYLFEPIMAAALGGVAFGARHSPIKRLSDGKKGRQVDCLVDANGEKLAYEFKLRMTIAASGQGRFKEELDFPRDAEASGYMPVLLVLDPTDSEKLTQLIAKFKEHGGDALIGEKAWKHIGERSGPTMAAFIEKYIRIPIEAIDADSESLLNISLQLDAKSSINITVGEVTWNIPRVEAALDGDVEEDED